MSEGQGGAATGRPVPECSLVAEPCQDFSLGFLSELECPDRNQVGGPEMQRKGQAAIAMALVPHQEEHQSHQGWSA